MLLYFAYGSNMSRARLAARVGEVQALGWSTLHGYRHAFNKRGADGTPKGNIVAAAGASVHGVLFRLTLEQLAVLERYEGGYRKLEREVLLQHAERLHASVTFEALAPVAEPPAAWLPSSEYVAHYEAGMREHDLPEGYRIEVLRAARR